jgi:Pyruvate/2-oxoacid:ferredoxin oxidoreductase delta subunit
MVCTSKSPEELAETYPFPFQGTVATVDAEAIFSKHVGIQPAPSGITALGLFVAATGKLVKIESVKEATMAHERLNRKVREENLPCLVEAYETAQVVSDVIIEERKDLQKAANKSGGSGTKWGKKLPFTSNPSNCTCAECMSAYFCPEAAITWQDDVMHFDLDACKSCGTCAVECLHDAITMEKAEKVMDALVK